jgi:isocitrate lyase
VTHVILILAVKQKVGESPQYNDFVSSIHGKSLIDARNLVQKHFAQEIDWSPEVCRTKEGHFQYAAGIAPAVSRVLSYAPYADMLWLETKLPDLQQAKDFASRIREKYPNKWLVYNLSPSFNWAAHGFSEQDLKEFCNELAKAGFVLQLISLAGLHSTAAITCELAKGFKEDGMWAYVNLIQRKEKEVGTDVLTHQKWSGANYIDGILQSTIPFPRIGLMIVVSAGSSATSSVGKDSTEHTF